MLSQLYNSPNGVRESGSRRFDSSRERDEENKSEKKASWVDESCRLNSRQLQD